MTIDRTSIVRNLVKIGNLANYNFYLSKFVENLIKKHKINLIVYEQLSMKQQLK